MKPDCNDNTSFVSVIVPVHNDAERLHECLKALEAQTYPPLCYEIIVVDNASDPPLDQNVTAFNQTRLVRETQLGSYAARNTGLAHAKGDILAFIDADCIPIPAWLENGVSHLERNQDCGLVGGRVDVFPEDAKKPTASELYEMIYAFPIRNYVENKHFAPTCNLFTSRAVMDQVGPFNAALKSGGDTEWGQRVFAAGYHQIYGEDVVVRHPARRTLGDIIKKYKRLSGGRAAWLRGQTSTSRISESTMLPRSVVPRSANSYLARLQQADLNNIQRAQVLVILMIVYAIGLTVRIRRLIRTKLHKS